MSVDPKKGGPFRFSWIHDAGLKRSQLPSATVENFKNSISLGRQDGRTQVGPACPAPIDVKVLRRRNRR